MTQGIFTAPFLITRDCADRENLCHNFLGEISQKETGFVCKGRKGGRAGVSGT
jgi:hypothetical protein